jgi:hypothetical protein
MKMQRIIVGFVAAFACFYTHAAESITVETAVKVAEEFVAKNGYTNVPASDVKAVLDNERIERTTDRRDQIQQRFNTLLPKAIGAKKGRKGSPDGWSVAFDYTSGKGSSETCRVVTMNSAGSDIRVEHVDGIRSYFIGFTPSR